jgi:hypothetical protein
VKKEINTFIKTLSLTGFNVNKVTESEPTTYTGIMIDLKNEEDDHINISFTKDFSSVVGDNIPPTWFKDVKPNLVLEHIIHNLVEKS